MADNVVHWSYPTSIAFGQGSIRFLPRACDEAGIQSPLLVTDRTLAKLPMIELITDLLIAEGIEAGIFSAVDPNPTGDNLLQGVEVFRQGKHDGVIAVGGGSGLDLGKMIAFMAEQTRPVWDFEDFEDFWKRANADVIYPSIAIPTTAGTGSEVGRASVITDVQTKTKKVIFHPLVLPKRVLIDPVMTVSMPPSVTAGTGMDAFAHCLEAYCAPSYHPMSQGIALEGLRLIKENLKLVYDDGQYLEGRGHMMSAAAMGAVAFQKGLGAIHSISHPIGSMYDRHHGTTNAIVMPFVLEFNRPAIEDKICSAADYLNIGGGFNGFMDHVLRLREEVDIPSNLKEFGVPDDDLDTLTGMALKDPTAGGNPVPLSFGNTLELYQSCFGQEQ